MNRQPVLLPTVNYPFIKLRISKPMPFDCSEETVAKRPIFTAGKLEYRLENGIVPVILLKTDIGTDAFFIESF